MKYLPARKGQRNFSSGILNKMSPLDQRLFILICGSYGTPEALRTVRHLLQTIHGK